jgi:hypothetical protein
MLAQAFESIVLNRLILRCDFSDSVMSGRADLF